MAHNEELGVVKGVLFGFAKNIAMNNDFGDDTIRFDNREYYRNPETLLSLKNRSYLFGLFKSEDPIPKDPIKGPMTPSTSFIPEGLMGENGLVSNLRRLKAQKGLNGKNDPFIFTYPEGIGEKKERIEKERIERIKKERIKERIERYKNSPYDLRHPSVPYTEVPALPLTLQEMLTQPISVEAKDAKK